MPVPEAQKVFDMVHQVYRQMENLNQAVSSLHKGEEFTLSIACAPSIAQFIAARAIRNVRQRFPDLFIDLNILKIEETLDYLLLERRVRDHELGHGQSGGGLPEAGGGAACRRGAGGAPVGGKAGHFRA
ncbi:hypothetical protein [Pannonibacter phragmitetus]|uniref:hypothetical protein n=1 Tax=Pannonibacter phragmitetus TaxID=121719 RepID=UPI001FFDB899|nr:hypothetical protein [Pannonibacter phragmitetus]